ncbi:MAG TPA: BCAM0308 family protein [Usitatibacter sp.]|nr:BCAM0308 family protein [Usitatibacter sp.]
MKPERTAPSLLKRDAGFSSANDEDDPYTAAAKPPEGTACPKCKATFHGGRWTWEKPERDAVDMICPACQRIDDRFPAGYVTIKGEFFKEHRDEIVSLIESHEKKEKAARPLQRIMGMDQKSEGFEVQTTDSQLARGIGEALHEAYKGDLKVRYSRDEKLVRAVWKRER